jgi:Helix-turn-helix domain
MRLAHDLPAAWNAPTADTRTKQRLIHILIQEIVCDLDEAANEVVLLIHWTGGRHSDLRVLRVRTGCCDLRPPAPNAVEAIRKLATRWGDRYGAVSAKAVAVLEALLFNFHNVKNGWCFPSYKRIAEAAHCAASTVAEAIKALEAAGLMTWDHRIKRKREPCPDLLGPNGWRWRVVRTSNAYRFPSESDFQRGTTTPDSNSSLERPKALKNELSEGLAASFEHLWNQIQRKAEAKPA